MKFIPLDLYYNDLSIDMVSDRTEHLVHVVKPTLEKGLIIVVFIITSSKRGGRVCLDISGMMKNLFV